VFRTGFRGEHFNTLINFQAQENAGYLLNNKENITLADEEGTYFKESEYFEWHSGRTSKVCKY
jgi:hypothetical protein